MSGNENISRKKKRLINNKPLWLYLLAMILLISACSHVPVRATEIELQTKQVVIDPSPTATAVPKSTDTVTPQPTKTYDPLPTKTISPTTQPFKLYEYLQPGQYIIYTSIVPTIDNPTTADLNVISLDGKTIRTIARLEYWSSYFVKLSPDLKQVAYISLDGRVSILDLENGIIMNVPEVNSCLGFDWSPDSTGVVMACDNLYVFSVKAKKTTRLTNRRPGESTSFNAIAWSPDGKWFMAHSIYDNIWDRDSGGELYLINSTCKSDVDACLIEKQPFDKVRSEFYSPTWSPDSRFLAAFLSHGVIGVWEIAGKPSHKLPIPGPGWQHPGRTVVEWGHLAWSPDGEWFAYSQPGTHGEDHITNFDLFVIPIKGGKPRLVLKNTNINLVMGWMIFPDRLQ